MRLTLIYSIVILFCLQSCKEDQPDTPNNNQIDYDSLSMLVTPEYNGLPLSLDTIYPTSNGDSIQFSELKFYLTQLRNGNLNLMESALFDFRETNDFVFKSKGSPTDFLNLSSKLGVDVSLNHDDPSLFPNTSPLNILNALDMHWDWNPGYIFLKVEAKVDTIADGVANFDHFIVYHIGLDANCSDISWNSITWQAIGSNKYVFPLVLDMHAFFTNPASPIDIRTESMTHSAAGQEILTGKVIANFKHALHP